VRPFKCHMVAGADRKSGVVRMAIMSRRPRTGGVRRASSESPDAGNGEEFVVRLYRDYGRMLFSYADRLVDDRALADDVVQETLARAWRDREALTKDSQVRRRLLTIARDVIVGRLWATMTLPPEGRHGARTPPPFDDYAAIMAVAVAALESVAAQPHDRTPPDRDVVLLRTLRQVAVEPDDRRSRHGVTRSVMVTAVVIALTAGVVAGRQLADTGRTADAAPGPVSDDRATAATADFATVENLIKNRRARLGHSPDGSFANTCTINHRNSDNFITLPGIANGADHIHDYYGNGTTNAFSTIEKLRAAGPSECQDSSDISAYWAPALLRDDKPVRPDLALFILRGYDRDVGEVIPMPQGLKLITGNAKAVTAADSKAQFTCTGARARPAKTFPDCPRGSRLVRIEDFPSCWDGVHLDSPDHRTHVVFPQNGLCPSPNPVPLPRLRFMFVYPVSANTGIAMSSSPVARGLSFSDHADAVNLRPTGEMTSSVRDCINAGIAC
jgi:DNA-directed RNA polymerase specialized sigma24 family protein